ncbi:MAG TPA: benzoate-CoA ligase family protein [Solirubrobacteraceae bacterium]|nr:benzoate-CoA ligase family protein [Solirubrobacteraceae bacterium]
MHERANASQIVDRVVESGRGAKLAYVADDASLTYEQLLAQVARAGNLLRELGVRREQRVLLVLDDTTAFPALFLGAIRIGAVPVPVSVLDKPDNFRHFVEDSYAEVVACEAACLPVLREALARLAVRYLVRGPAEADAESLPAALAAQDPELDPVASHPDDMAFWLYSSGSTGRPKGVVHLQHDIGVTCQCFAGRILGLGPEDRVFSTTKLHHAYGLGNGLSFPLWFGATAVLMDGPPRPDRILSTLLERRPTVLCSVPALYALLCREPGAEGALDSVRTCVSAAEPLPAPTLRRWRERFGVSIIDGVGSTEMLHIYCSNRPGEVVPGTSGWPVPGYELRLVDDQGTVLEGPAAGSLEVRGDSCTAYYWHQRDKSRRTIHGEWFATGDRYERRADGTYAFVGRMDDMLKVGGLWFSPVDMEHVLLEHPHVRGAGVVGVEVQEISRIAAFIECNPDAPAGEALADELRAWCKARMRRYEYPHEVHVVDALPRTLTGKVQRFRLRELAAQRAEVT